MKKFLPLLFSLILAVPAFAAPATDAPEVPAVIELEVGSEVRRFRLIPKRGEEEDQVPRTEEVTPAVAPDLSVSAPSPRGEGLEALVSIFSILVPIFAGGVIGGAAGPKIASVLSTVLAGLKNRQPPTPSDPTTKPNSHVGIIRIAEVLQNLAPIIEALSHQVPKPTSTPDVTTPPATK